MKNFKNIFKYILVLSTLGVFLLNTSCEDPDEMTYKAAEGTPYFHFGGPATSDTIKYAILQTAPSPLNVTLYYSTEGSTNEVVNVPFTIEGSSSAYTVVGGETSFQFDAGEVESTIQIMPVTGVPAATLYLKLGTPSNGGSIGYPGGNASLVEISILTCPTNYGLWFGNLNAEDVGYGSVGAVGSTVPSLECDILLVDGDLPNSGQTPSNTKFELVFTPAFDGATNGTVEVEPTKYINSLNFTTGAYAVYYQATGIYDEGTETITLNYTVTANNISTGAVVGTWYTGANIITPL